MLCPGVEGGGESHQMSLATTVLIRSDIIHSYYDIGKYIQHRYSLTQKKTLALNRNIRGI